MNKKILLVIVAIIAIIAIVGIVLVSTTLNDGSNTFKYNGFEFVKPEGFVNLTNTTGDKDYVLNNSQGKTIEIRTYADINNSVNPSILEFNGLKINKYSNMEVAASIEYVDGEFVVTSYTHVTVYTFTSNGKTFYILIEKGIANPDEVVKNMTVRNS